MCMKDVNATVQLFKRITREETSITGFLEPYNCIEGKINEESGNLQIGDINILTCINIMGSLNTTENLLEKDETLDFKVRITKCTNKDDELKSIDLDEFNLQLKGSSYMNNASNIPFIDYRRITTVNNIVLDIPNPKGNYVIKVLVKFSSDEKYKIQSQYSLVVE